MQLQNQPNKFSAILPYFLSIFTFFAGNYINSISYTDKVDGLVTSVNLINQKFDNKTEKDAAIDKRVSKIEFYLFEYKKPTTEPTQN